MLPLRAKTDETISPKSPFLDILAKYRNAAKTEREKGTYFEELIVTYLRNEPTYKDLYKTVQTYSDWAAEQGTEGKDTGIDLVALTNGTNEYHAIQCKFYAENHRIQKSDIDSFFTASGKAPFKHRVIITTTNNWGEHAENALNDQTPPVTKIDLHALENSQIDWEQYQPHHAPVLKEKKALRPHQQRALQAVKEAFETVDRGKLLMACGTGKTFTSLKIAEAVAGKNKRVLFLVPSLSLLSQTLTEWTQESDIPLRSFAVCSDSDVGKKRDHDDDVVQTFTHELQYPATTNALKLAQEMGQRHDDAHMTVVFSTYHSLAVIHEAQQQHGLPAFDLIVGDEAHRTTGATFADDKESAFVKVHDADYIKAHKRLYMTATPRIYAPLAKATAERDSIALCSMDDPAIYGETLFTITFSEAVTLGLLVDYKVIVLTIDEAHISSRLQKLLADEDNQLKVDDAAKIVGCWKALSKQEQEKTLLDDDAPMQRAVAFCQVIEPRKKAKIHKVSSKNIAAMFQRVVEAYQEQEDDHNTLICEAEHVDGSMNATEKENKLKWLKADLPDDKCRILSNVRCLSEGVDVPALDAVLFLTPRDSQVDVVQSVGRIMRNAPKKKRGYVILPVVIPTGMEPHEALNDNKTYKVVWEVLNALRSHDDRFDAHINKLELIGKDNQKMEVIAITDKVGKKNSKNSPDGETGKGEYKIGEKAATKAAEQLVFDLKFKLGEIERALYAKIVQKCGNRHHWEDWATDIAKIAQTHITRIRAILDTPENTKEIAAFTAFAGELRDDLNGSITDDEVIEMLAQHLITKPVFDALFEGYSFAGSNPVSQAMQHTLDVLQQHHLDKETDTLEQFYQSVKMRAAGIENAAAKQKIVVELYDKFFRKAFPKMTERLGIVYTPVEIVDFIIHSVNDVLKEEFGQTLGSKGVHIIDPFTGTGTFITRMLQSGLISPEQLPHKYAHEIHANEIVLLAYYIAAINIEAVYHGLMGGNYKPFQGICLTDTFQLYEKDDMLSKLLVDNSARRTRQKNLPIRVIMGNPPYSAGQQSANDNAANIEYPHLDASIRNTYAASGLATLQKGLYDSYIRAIRWGSDRLGDSGVLAYVSNAGWLDGKAMDGLRKCLAKEFSSLYVFHLRGNARTSGELRRKEKDNVFGQGTRTPISVSVFVKNPNATSHGNIYFHDIGDYLSQQQKLEIIQTFKSINGIKAAGGWQTITPDKHHDWLTQRDDSFEAFISLGDKKNKKANVIFGLYSSGVKTNRDAWCYNFSKSNLNSKISSTINFYNSQVDDYKNVKSSASLESVKKFINTDPRLMSWDRAEVKGVLTGRKVTFKKEFILKSAYRPFQKQWMYFDRNFNNCVYQMPQIFPHAQAENRVICVSGVGAKDFSCCISNTLPDIQLLFNGQCFPLYLYEPATEEAQNPALIKIGTTQNGYTRRDGISKEGLQHFQSAYPTETITREDVFYYVYGLLHSPVYREKYGDNLSKELPRMPRVKTAADFWAFSTAGRALADLHIGYETAEPYPVTLIGNPKTDDDYRVTKMKFASKGDKSTIIYNAHITLKDIPPAAFDYVVNGKPAVEWVMERQCVKTDKDSGIVNDANLYATETMGNAKYPLELLLRVITVSLKTSDIVAGLPVCAYLEDA
jgi:predicted helicase